MARRAAAFVLVLALGALVPPLRASADPIGSTEDAVLAGLAATCRRVPTIDPAQCTAIDHPEVSERMMADYEASWTHRALSLQRQLDDASPLLQALVPHTHNSFNSSRYQPSLTSLDPNQLYSITDQLRMDMRGIELDVHWAPNPLGDPADGFNAVVLCHGEPVQIGPATAHIGCSVDRLFTDGLAELRAWLTAPGNESEVLVLYLENNLDGNEKAHDLAAQALEQELGDLVLRPPTDQPCAPMPLDMSRAGIRATGARVLIVGNCGPGAWGSWVHERGPQWDESGSGPGDDYPDFSACAAERAEVGYDAHWVRRYEDSTWLSAMAGGGGEVTATEVRNMVRCGVNMPGFDQLYPQDPRLTELVWSWAPDEPAADPTRACTYEGTDARFRAGHCGERRRFACADAAGNWFVTRRAGTWAKGARACPATFPGTHFAVPANGYQNELLAAAVAAASAPPAEVWLDLPVNR